MGDRRSAIAFFNQGVAAHQTRDLNDKKMEAHLYQLFASACMADPTWWQPFYQVGNNNSDLKLYYSAIANWRRALECNPAPRDKAKVLANLAWRLHSVGYTDEAFKRNAEALELDPTLVNCWMNATMMHYTVGDRVNAMACARQAYKLEPSSETEYNLAFGLMFGREFALGLKHFEARFRYRLKEYMQYPYPKWEGESDKILLVAADQGMGDTLSFARFLPEACKRSKYVVARIQAPLLRLFTHAFVGIPNLELVPGSYPFPTADCWTTFVSLPGMLGLSDEEIRAAPPVPTGRWDTPFNWKVPDRKLHIGIAWAGSPLNDIDVHRNLPVHLFMELHRVPGIQLYSLQVGERANDIHMLGGGSIVRDVTPYITDVVDTVSILQKLDMVITCESALGHICALINKECWIPYSWLGRDYRIGCDGTDMIWTPAHRIFRQDASLDWRPVFKAMTEALAEKIDGLAQADRKAATQA